MLQPPKSAYLCLGVLQPPKSAYLCLGVSPSLSWSILMLVCTSTHHHIVIVSLPDNSVTVIRVSLSECSVTTNRVSLSDCSVTTIKVSLPVLGGESQFVVVHPHVGLLLHTPLQQPDGQGEDHTAVGHHVGWHAPQRGAGHHPRPAPCAEVHLSHRHRTGGWIRLSLDVFDPQ